MMPESGFVLLLVSLQAASSLWSRRMQKAGQQCFLAASVAFLTDPIQHSSRCTDSGALAAVLPLASPNTESSVQ